MIWKNVKIKDHSKQIIFISSLGINEWHFLSIPVQSRGHGELNRHFIVLLLCVREILAVSYSTIKRRCHRSHPINNQLIPSQLHECPHSPLFKFGALLSWENILKYLCTLAGRWLNSLKSNGMARHWSERNIGAFSASFRMIFAKLSVWMIFGKKMWKKSSFVMVSDYFSEK